MRRRRSSFVDDAFGVVQDALSIFSQRTVTVGIDLGSMEARFYIEGKGIVLRENTYVAYNKKSSSFFAAGNEAYDMLGKTPPDLIVSSPMARGRVSDFDGLVYFMQSMMQRVLGKQSFYNKFRAIISVPMGLTEVEEMALIEVGKKVGARSVLLVETPIAAGFGLHMPVLENVGTAIVDVGSGTTEMSVISLGGIVISRVLTLGGIDFNEAIINYLRIRYGVLIGEKTAEEVKKSMGPIMHQDDVMLEIHGRSIETGMPKMVKVKNNLLYEALYPYFGKIIEMLREIIEETPPELIPDITKKGVLMTGGSSRFQELDAYITDQLGIKVHTVTDAGDSVVKGLGWLIEHQNYLERVAIKL